MSVIKPIKPVPQQHREGDIQAAHNEQSNKFLSSDLGVILIVAVAGLIGLSVLAYYRVSNYSVRLAFVVASALPLFTLLAIIYQAVVYRRQWNVMQQALKQTEQVIDKMQGQLKEIQKQSGILDKTLAETAKIAEHSERGIEVARESTEYAQRAYVSITQKGWTGTGFSVAIENSGNTPAREVMVAWFIDAGESPPPGFSKLGDPAYPKTFELGLLAPRSPEGVFIPCNRSLTAKEEEDYRESPDLFHWWVRGSYLLSRHFPRASDWYSRDRLLLLL